jgi:acyl-CoA synthetase (AMP-forming)/AMP-acid ligase II
MRNSLSDKFAKLIQAAFLNLDSNNTIAFQFERHASQIPSHPFLLYEERRYSYAEANALINKHAHAYMSVGVQKGDVVALMMENRPEFLWHFLGLNKIGAVASLINTNSIGDILAHALRVCAPKRVIVGSEVWDNYEMIRSAQLDLPKDSVDIDLDPAHPVDRETTLWDERLRGFSEANPVETSRHTLSDGCALIYTSGTTGLPKPAIIKNCRVYRAGRIWSTVAFRLNESDRLYNCLPLYHSNSILLATGSVITSGTTLALARKFSANRFWDDIRKHNATSFVYIGELCRFLMNRPPDPQDRDHNIRVISGNGLRSDIWQAFQNRFGIEQISEFYASTEGNAFSINLFNRPGSVGIKLPILALVKWDETRQDFVRDKNGFLVKCRTDEAGVLLGRIRENRHLGRLTVSTGYDGYLDREATEKKILRDVFRKGDSWFNTGDVLRCDKTKHLYFVDRLGDTFRWKGENVSTFEVQEQIAKWRPVRHVNVYGVQLPGAEGRAGMASMVLDDPLEFDPKEFKSHVDLTLPSYARPLFVRLSNAVDATSTFKLKKAILQKQGFNPDTIDDDIYFRHPDNDEYVPMTKEIYHHLSNQRLRV